LGIVWGDFALADSLFNLICFVEPLLFVAELAAFGGNEKIFGGTKVKMELVMLLVVLVRVLFLRGFVSAH
jgi:hypothetical protein